MLVFLREYYYFLNLFFVALYSSVLLIYLGHFNPESPKTAAFQRMLIGVICWAFYDLLIWEIGRDQPSQTAYSYYRYLSFLFLLFPVVGGELIISLIRRVTWKDRVMLGWPYLALYLSLLLFPQWANAATFNIQGGHPGPMAPWNTVFKTITTTLVLALLGWLVLSARSEPEKAVRREKTVLFLGGLAFMGGTVLSQVLTQRIEGLPWMGNLSTFWICLAAFWGIHRYGRVLSPRRQYETILRIMPNGAVHFTGGVINWVNRSMAEYLGYAGPGDLIGQPVDTLLYQEDGAVGQVERLVTRLPRGLIQNEEVALRGRGGGPCFFLVNSAPLKTDDPGLGSLAVFTDISTQRQVREEVKKRAKLEGIMEMSGAACHELNQPLQVIAGQLDLMEMAVAPGRKPQEKAQQGF